jgi:hypothetical protein
MSQQSERWDVFSIREVQGKTAAEDKSYWTRIGAAFRNRDGSINVVLSALPVGGVDGQARVQLRIPDPKDERDSRGDREVQDRANEQARNDRDTRGPRR